VVNPFIRLYNGKASKTINVPGAASSYPTGLNNSDDVTCEWIDASNAIHGALLDGGEFYKLNPGWTES
jgi:hypothetical protein